MGSPRYEFAALARAMGLNEAQAAKRLGVSGHSESDYRSVGMSELVADRLAVRAGFHPFTIWPEMALHNLEPEQSEGPTKGTYYDKNKWEISLQRKARRAAKKDA